METSEALVGHTKTIIAASAVYFGFTLSEWAAIFAIVFGICQTVAVLPATVKVIKDFIAKVRNRGGK